MQTCSAVVVSVSRQGLASAGFQDRSTHSAFEGPDLGTRYLFNREVGLIKYNHKEEPLGTWHEVEHHWLDDDGYGNGIPTTGACAGHINKKLDPPKCHTEGLVYDSNVHHFYCGVGIALDVEPNYMTIWHDYLGLVVHFGDKLYEKFQPLQPLNIKTQPCAEHRFYGFHATRVTAAASIRLKYLYFAADAELESYDNFLVAKCYNGHRVVLLDKKRAPVRPGEEEGHSVGDKVNLAYYRIYTAYGPIYISAFVTNDEYFTDYFERLCNTRAMNDYMHENYNSSKSQVDMLSPAQLKRLCEDNLDCWNVDHEDVSWYTNRFFPDTANSVGPSRATRQKEVEEEAFTVQQQYEEPQLTVHYERQQEDEEEFSDSVFLPREPSLDGTVVESEGDKKEEAPMVEEKKQMETQEEGNEKGDGGQELELDGDFDIDLDLGDLGELGGDALPEYGGCDDVAEEEKEGPVPAPRTVYPLINQSAFPTDNQQIVTEEDEAIREIQLFNIEPMIPLMTPSEMKLYLVAKWRIFATLSCEEMVNTLEEGMKRRVQMIETDVVTETLKPRGFRERVPSWQRPTGTATPIPQQSATAPQQPTTIPQPTTTIPQPTAADDVASRPRPIGGLPLGMGAPIPVGMMKQTSTQPVLPPSSSASLPPTSSSQQPAPSTTSSNRRIGIVPRKNSLSGTSESDGSSTYNKLNNSTRSFKPAKVAYLDLGPMHSGEDAVDYLDRVMDVVDSKESKTTRLILNQVVTNKRIQERMSSCFPALHDVLHKMYSQPNEVILSSLDPLTNDKIESTKEAMIDRLLMESAVLDLLKTKSKPLWDCIREELPFVDGL